MSNLLDKEIIKDLKINGIPSRYCTKKLKLADYGVTAIEFKTAIGDPEKFTELVTDTKFYNFYSADIKREEVLTLIIREMLLVGRPAGFVWWHKLFERDQETLDLIFSEQKRYIGMTGFAQREFTKWIHSEKYTQTWMERVLKDFMENGGVLFVSSDSQIEDFEMYSLEFRDYLMLVGKDILVNAGK